MIEVKGVFGRWYGGSSYSSDHSELYVESFGSMTGAREALLERLSGGTFLRAFDYVLRPAEYDATPAADERSRIELCRVFINAGRVVIGETYAELTIGARGGVRRSKL